MLSIISSKYYIVNLVVNYLVNYLVQILCSQFSRQLCCHLCCPKIMLSQFSRQLCCQLSRPNIILSILSSIMSSFILTKYYRPYHQFSHQLCCQLSHHLDFSSCPFRGSVHLGANCYQIYSTCSYLRNVENFLVSCSEPHCFVGDEI